MSTKILSLAALLVVSSIASSTAADIPTTTYDGNVVVRTDVHDRVVVVVDADRDGWADQLFLFDPHEPLPEGLAERELRARVSTSPNELQVLASDGSLTLRLFPLSASDGSPSTVQNGAFVIAHGKALVHHRVARGTATVRALDSDAVPSVLGGTGDPCSNDDLACQSGGEGSTGCSMSCGGGGLTTPIFGGHINSESCGVSCDISRGYYACCNCTSGGARCTCKQTPAGPCLSTPDN